MKSECHDPSLPRSPLVLGLQLAHAERVPSRPSDKSCGAAQSSTLDQLTIRASAADSYPDQCQVRALIGGILAGHVRRPAYPLEVFAGV